MQNSLLTSLLAATLAWPIPAGPEPENPYALAARTAGDGKTSPRNYLRPLVELRHLQPAYTGDTAQWERSGTYWQVLATYAALADEADSATVYWRRQSGYGEQPVQPGASLATQPARAAILSQTKQRQVVMFNEEHTQPRGRWLVGSLLPALYQQGFRYLALEALNTDDSTGVRQRGYPVASSGFYTNEPHFGNLIRQARQLGFRVVGYDAMSSERERDQARNLLAVSVGTDPKARMVVLAGHSHISEQGEGRNKPMAQWLHELSGIDPLTIEQTQLVTAQLPGLRQLPAGAYVVPQARAALPAGRAMSCDMFVFNNLQLVEAGNSFGQRTGRLTALVAPTDSLRPGQPHVLLVYQQREWLAQANAEPVAVRCLQPGQARARLRLLPGTYVVALRDAPGRRCWQQVLQVP